MPSGLTLDAFGWDLGAENSWVFGPFNFAQATFDEFRFSDTVRSADWIAAEYSNQVSPSTFLKLYPENAVTVNVLPSTAALSGLHSQQFAASVYGSGGTPSLAWSRPRGGPDSLPSAGLYTAPVVVPAQQTVTVTAATQSGPSGSGSAAVTLMPVSMLVNPNPATLYAGQSQQFTAVVADAPPSAAVSWTLQPPEAGTISPSGFYSAPTTVAAQQTVSVIATSKDDPSKSATATVTLLPAAVHVPPAVSVSVSPQTVALQAGQTQQFAATVTNAADTAVTWSLTPSDAGTIDANGFYAAPSAIASPQTVAVTAASEADPTKTGSATLTLIPGPSLLLDQAVAPDSAPSGQTVTLLASGFPAGEIAPANIVVTLQPQSAGAPAAAAAASALYPISTNTSAVTFVIPDSLNVLQAVTSYSVAISGATTDGVAFASQNWVGLSVTPPARLVAVAPSVLKAGHTITVALTGQYTQFVQNVTLASFGGGIGVGPAATAPIDLSGAADQLAASFCRAPHHAPVLSVVSGLSSGFPLVGTPYTFSATITEYELAPGTPALVFGGWSVSGPGSVVFNNQGGLTTDATFSAPGNYTLQFSAFDGLAWGSATTSFTIRDQVAPQNSLTLAPTTSGPYSIGQTAQIRATLLNQNNRWTDYPVLFTVSGANPSSAQVLTDTNGVATLQLTGALAGTDTVTAQATVAGVTLQSNPGTVTWAAPKPVGITMGPVQGQFFYADGSGVFNTPAPQPGVSGQQMPVFTQWFPSLVFNPAAGTIPGAPKSVKNTARPFQYVGTKPDGSYAGSITAQDNSYALGHQPQAGVYQLWNFSAVFTGSLIVSQPGNVALHITAADGWMLGIGGGATAQRGPRE